MSSVEGSLWSEHPAVWKGLQQDGGLRVESCRHIRPCSSARGWVGLGKGLVFGTFAAHSSLDRHLCQLPAHLRV